MIDFGFSTKESLRVQLNDDDSVLTDFIPLYSTLRQCIQCGSCSATCASPYTPRPHFREALALVRRGLVLEAQSELKGCINCSKCQLVCPAIVETRKIIYSILKYSRI